MSKQEWKCPSCGYLNVALDTECASCGHVLGEPARPTRAEPRRKGNANGRLFGCLIVVLAIGASGFWLSRTPLGRFVLAGKVRGASDADVSQLIRDEQAGPEAKAAKKRIEAEGKEIERLVGVLQDSTDAEVISEALQQLRQKVDALNSDYPDVYGFHATMPRSITKAVDYGFGFVTHSPQSPLAPAVLDLVGSTLLKWQMDDLRRYEPQLLQLLGSGTSTLDQQPYEGSDPDIYRQHEDESERNRKLRAQDEDMHGLECDLLEYGIYPKRFKPQKLINDAEQNDLSEDLDAPYAQQLVPKLRAAAAKSQSSYGLSNHASDLADKIEGLLHAMEVRKKVAGG